MISHYSKADLVATFRALGLQRGQVVFSHSNIGYFGIPAEGNDRATADRVVLEAFQEVLGPKGTLVVPTFTYSFPKGQDFDPVNTPSASGPWTNFIRSQPGAHRSLDPIFSVAAIGARAEELTRDVPQECFGKDSFWDRFLQADGIVCNLNVWVLSTFIHFVERQLNVPYRYDKVFTGFISEDGVRQKTGSLFYCQDPTNPDTRVTVKLFDDLALKTGLAKKATVGRGHVTAMSARDMYALIEQTLPTQPYFLIQAGLEGKAPALTAKRKEFDIDLPASATMKEMVHALWHLPRDIVSDGYDAALEALAQQVPMKINAYPTGTHVWTWLVPERWTCHEARLETMDGRVLIDYKDTPLHCVSYSLPFNGVVSREVLLEHLHVHPYIEHATPFIFKYYDRDWGLCCPRTLRDSLTDEQYRVVIRSEFSFGHLKVGEVFVQGESDDCIVLCAHLCHPGQVADDLSGVVAGIEVMRTLMKRKNRYSYRLLILPETIGSVSWLSHNEHLIPNMKGGLFIEMLSLPYPHVLQMSFASDSLVDRCFLKAVQAHDPAHWTGAFRTVVGNDERQFNAPGVRVPMLSLSRVLGHDQPQRPYPQYHSTEDNPNNANWTNLDDSVQLILRMIDTLEAAPVEPTLPKPCPATNGSRVPKNLFKGEVFCSRYGINIDIRKNREGHRALFNILFQIDGQNSIEEIASRCHTTVEAVEGVLTELKRHGLVELE